MAKLSIRMTERCGREMRDAVAWGGYMTGTIRTCHAEISPMEVSICVAASFAVHWLV